ncbi:MAG: hypothetical protein OEV94_03570 [Deltaproteobacteria bacterium]|nr:hypothetical protein [Deltaproteobacteria bacterium]
MSVTLISVPCPACRKVHKITSDRYVSTRPIQCTCGQSIPLDGDLSRVKVKKEKV